jgi:hypothetical protein
MTDRLPLRRIRKTTAAALLVAAGALSASASPAAAGTITLNTLSDEVPVAANGICTLREALNESNSDSPITSADCAFEGTLGHDTINLPAGTLQIQGPDNSEVSESLNEAGDFDVRIGDADSLTVNGAGKGLTVIDGNGKDRIFDAYNVNSSTLGSRHFHLNDLTLTGGDTRNNGGALRAANLQSEDSNVHFDSVRVTENRGDFAGGGIALQDAVLHMADSEVTHNRILNEIGHSGAGISALSTSDATGVNAVRSTVSSNVLEVTDDGFFIYGGGGLYLSAMTPGNDQTFANFVDSTISNNRVLPGGPQGVTTGAGVYALDGSLTLRRSTVSGNKIGHYPGGRSGGYAGILFWDTSTDAIGGGNANDELIVENSTIANNDAGQPASSGDGTVAGGIGFFDGIGKIVNSTFVGNEAQEGKDLSSFPTTGRGASMTIRGTIFADAPACETFGGSTQGGGSIEVGDDTCGLQGGSGTTPGANGDIENLPAEALNLGPLQDNGGPTLTAAPGVGSVALDAIAPANCLNAAGEPLTDDQRGVTRPAGTGCESGSVEATTCQGQLVNKVGTPGDDSLEGTDEADVIDALGGNDTIDSGGGADTICAGEGDDDVFPGSDVAADTVDAGAGTDTLSYAAATAGVNVDLGAGTASGQGADLVTGFENAVGSDLDDNLIGTGDVNLLTGGDGPDQIFGLAGADAIFARDGLADTVDCGDDADSVQTDTAGVDTLAGCETADLMPLPDPPVDPPDPPAGPGADPTPQPKPKPKCKKAKKKKGKKAPKKRCKKK